MNPAQIEMLIASLLLILRFVAEAAQSSTELTTEQKQGFLDRLEIIKLLVEQSKFPIPKLIIPSVEER